MAAVWVGTTQGAFALEGDGRRRRWRQRGPFLEGQSVNHFAWDPLARTLYAASFDDGVFATRTGGRTWTPLNKGLSVRRVWTLAVNPRDADDLWAGTHFSYLFRSADRGATWKVVPGYLTAPGHEGRYGDWGWGTMGNGVHTIVFDPERPTRMYVVSSSGKDNSGALRTDDAGATWKPIRKGTYEFCPASHPGDRPGGPSDHLENEHTCTHRLAVAAGSARVLYRQMHCGVYRSSDYGATWRDVSAGLGDRHGFPLAVHPRERDTLFVVPAHQGRCKRHNSCIEGQLEVSRSRTGGRRWEALTAGLPPDAHCVVLRHGMAADALNPAGIYFGTTTGEVYGSADEGDSWRVLASGLPRVQGVLAVVG